VLLAPVFLIQSPMHLLPHLGEELLDFLTLPLLLLFFVFALQKVVTLFLQPAIKKLLFLLYHLIHFSIKLSYIV
jgi:hypothetical protein